MWGVQRQLAKRHGAPLELSCANVCIITFQFKLLYLPLGLYVVLNRGDGENSRMGGVGQYEVGVAKQWRVRATRSSCSSTVASLKLQKLDNFY